MTPQQMLSRRRMLGTVGATAAGVLVAGRTPVASLLGGGDALAASSCASLTPAKEIGPYFVEEKLNRSDITTDPGSGVAVTGVPLALKLTLLNEADGCAPLAGAQVDIWHAAPSGLYSDESGEGTAGKKYLRGYQVSDASGVFTFGLGGASDTGGTSTTTTTTTTTTTPSTTTPASDTTVAASLAATSCTRGALGTRTLHARLMTKETVSLDVRLLRGSKVIARKRVASLSSGAHTVSVPIARSASAGRVTLSVTAKDASSNRKVLTRILSIPPRLTY